jgi:hypothetical protein
MPDSPAPAAQHSTRDGRAPVRPEAPTALAVAPRAEAGGLERPERSVPLPGFVGRERELAALAARLEAAAVGDGGLR